MFVVEGEEFPAHKMVLATQSEYFRQLLYGGMREASQKKIPISGITPDIFEIVLEYVYTRSAIEKPLDVSVIYTVHHLARRSNHFILSMHMLPHLHHTQRHKVIYSYIGSPLNIIQKGVYACDT